MSQSRVDAIAFWVSVVWATVAATLLGFQLAKANLPVSLLLFAVFTSWMGLYFGMNHVYEAARRAKGGTR